MADEGLLREAQVAELLDLHRVTLSVWRHEGRGPTYIKIGRNVRYRLSDVESYLERATIKPRTR